MKAVCSPRERVLRTIHHVEPDRVPIHYFDNPALRKRMAAHFGVSPDSDDALFEKLEIDFRGIWLPYCGPRLHAEIAERDVDPA